MQISYELDYRDAARFTLYRSLENADVKRRKTVLRWMVTIMLLAIIPAFQLKHPAAISLVLVICFLWLAFCDTFMNHILLKQILKEHKEITYELSLIHICCYQHTGTGNCVGCSTCKRCAGSHIADHGRKGFTKEG